ncbi:MAG TPA: hypothetical protein VGC90_02190 [Candidatus Limnocylindrales bacterium]
MPTTSPTLTAAPGPAHPCVRCGRTVAADVSLCELCNPLGLSQPATSQAHGTVFVAIIGAVVALAVAGKLVLAGVGPFQADVSGVTTATAGLAVELAVHNEGSKAGSTTCRITEASRGGTGPAAVVQTPRVDPGSTLRFSTSLTEFGTEPLALAVSCQSP